jgi:hypothetical protein
MLSSEIRTGGSNKAKCAEEQGRPRRQQVGVMIIDRRSEPTPFLGAGSVSGGTWMIDPLVYTVMTRKKKCCTVKRISQSEHVGFVHLCW